MAYGGQPFVLLLDSSTFRSPGSLAMLPNIFFTFFWKTRFVFFPSFCWENMPPPPGSLKLDAGSQGEFIWAQSERIWPIPLIVFVYLLKVQKIWPKNETFFNFFPTPQPPGPSPQTPKDAPDHAGVVGQSFIPIGPNGASFMPIFRFKFWRFS